MPIKVILVEDDPDIRHVLAKTLAFRYDVADFGDAREALDHLEAGPADYNVAVIDLWLPGMDGLTLIEKMHESETLRQIAVIIITGIVNDRELPTSFWTKNLGIAGFFHKPFHPEDLVKKIEDVVRERMGMPPEDDQGKPRGGYL